MDPDFRGALKRAGLLTRDARMVERKKLVLRKPVKLHNSQNVNLFQIYQRFEQLFGGDWCNIQSASYKYQKDTRILLVSFCIYCSSSI